jgi:hypothetical protein
VISKLVDPVVVTVKVMVYLMIAHHTFVFNVGDIPGDAVNAGLKLGEFLVSLVEAGIYAIEPLLHMPVKLKESVVKVSKLLA